jgi:hypothetical protein
MSETLNVNVLVAAKEEYSKQLIFTLQGHIYKIIKNIYIMSQKNNIRRDISYSNFQKELKQVPNWASFKLDENLSEINSGCPYLMDLITAIFVSHVKILACVRLKRDNKSIKIKVPNLNTFLHKILISVSENIYYNPYVIHEEKIKIYDIINKCITDTIANQIPIEYILNEYLAGVFDEENEQLENQLGEPDFEPEEHDENENENENEESEFEEDTKNIPIIPIQNNITKAPVPEKLDSLDIEKKLRHDEITATKFRDLKGKKDTFKVKKSEEEISDEENSDEEISDEESGGEISDEDEPIGDKTKEENVPTLF